MLKYKVMEIRSLLLNKLRNSATIFVYLDTSFLSPLAKADVEELETLPSAKKWKVLLGCLRDAVHRGILACHVSEFQIQEALLAPDLLGHITRIQHELSRGYYFRDWQDILIHQTAMALRTYLRQPEETDTTWTPFVGGLLSFVVPQETIRAKTSALRFCEELRGEQIPRRTFTEQYKAERTGLLQESFLQPLRQILGIDTYRKSPDPFREILDSGLFGKLLREARISAGKPGPKEFSNVLCFFESDWIDRVPFIHIACSIHASLMVHERERRPKIGDFIDIPSIACALPYCEILTTDANMRQHTVSRLRLNEKYQAGIFCATSESLDSLISLFSDIC